MKRIASIVVALALLMATHAAAAERSVTVTDMSGDTVTVTGEVKRVVHLWPAGTSSFFAMGAGDLLVGLSNSANLNDWVKLFYPNCVNITSMGGNQPTVESIVQLAPDLVVIHPSTASSGFAKQIRDMGIPAVNIDFNNYETMIKAYTMLGEILGGEYQQKLALWCKTTADKIAGAKKMTAGVAEADKPVLFYIPGQTNKMAQTMPHDSIFSDWAEAAGGVYGTKRMPEAAMMATLNNDITPEAIFALNPDVIIIGGVWQHVVEKGVLNDAGWKDLKAVKNGRVYTNPYACFNWDRFGLESQMQIDYALWRIQPDIAQANGINRDSMIAEMMDFYKTYTNFNLTRQQAEYMLDGLGPDGKAEHPAE